MSGKPASRRKKGRKSATRRISLRVGIVLAVLLFVHAGVSDWFVHHPYEWLKGASSTLPAFVYDSLYATGNVVGDLTDALDWTGVDAVYEYDTAAPNGSVLFAGAPVRTGSLAPDDIVILDRGEFKIGWSPRLRHPLWCAYHVVPQAKFPASRTRFHADRQAPNCPLPGEYEHSGYDRGHMVPNRAIVTRYGEAAQKLTFQMSNISPQTPSLNRGPWRDIEHRIADYFTARYGEIWVIVGAIPGDGGLAISGINVPWAYYQIVVAQEGMDVRAFAVLLPQKIAWSDYAARHLISIDKLEEMTGLDFLPELPSFVQTPLEAQCPTRLWPVRLADVFGLVTHSFAADM